MISFRHSLRRLSLDNLVASEIGTLQSPANSECSFLKNVYPGCIFEFTIEIVLGFTLVTSATLSFLTTINDGRV